MIGIFNKTMKLSKLSKLSMMLLMMLTMMVFIFGCSTNSTGSEDDTEIEIDADADSDTDADGDTDADSDTDADTDTDADCDMSELAAFPCAEGYGKVATGGRGGDVYEVTNLDASGAGSLGDALSESGRTVVFRVSGTIVGRFQVPDNTTIAGQTAPGDGITIFGQLALRSNVIVRYIRVRYDGNGDEDAMGCKYQSEIMVDHVSASWSRDEVLTIYATENVTIQWSMISEACPNEGTDSHRFGGIWGSESGTHHHNLIAHNQNRTPRWSSGCGHNDFRNNVVYNWGYGGMNGGEYQQPGDDRFVGCWINLVANYFKPGPGSEHTNRFADPGSRSDDDKGSWHVSENVMEGNDTLNTDNWVGLVGSEWLKMDSPWDSMAINQQSAHDAYEAVLADVGASLPARDSIDERIVNDARNGTGTLGTNGYPACPADTVLPTLNSTPAPADADHDGMPDEWETANGLDPNNADDRNQTWGPGYTMLEKYLNSLDSF